MYDPVTLFKVTRISKNAVGFFKQVPKFRTQGDIPPRHLNSSVVLNEEKGAIYIFLRDFRLPQMKSAVFRDLNAA